MTNYSLEHKHYLKNVKKQNTIIIVTRLVILITFFILWEIAGYYKWVDPFLTSTPSRILKSLIKVYSEGTLFRHILVTCFETILGFISSTVLGTLIAILLWTSDFTYKVLDPYVVVLNALPKVALAPIIIFWMGNGMKAIILVAILISIVTTIISVLNGFREVSEDKIKLLQTFGASKLQILTHLIIPASVPTFISALKINVGLSWVGVIMGEFLVSKEGLGFLIVFGGQIAQLDTVMMSIIILSVLAYLMYQIVAVIEKKFL
ncbi:ABC transporter permease [Clostridium sp. SYSU_GA19001]|uniref:ABC transporter permease n=1 Tax=Clostridium caldaquaticum TaxID=2940653 RepID=UPI0020775409|nr:ABC transporter permease [Clostridium caldaquaticum]MCM8711656.1 ABC transporter permease [Clostridium caldaquaticum]